MPAFASSAVAAEIDERVVQLGSGLSAPDEIAALLAREKARSVSTCQAGRYAIGADQTLALGQQLFSKPPGRAEAAEQLRALAGQSHELHSAVAVARDGKILFETVAVARMTMRRLTGAEIRAYLDEAGEAVTSSVGAYQPEGSVFICSNGSKAIISRSSDCRCYPCLRFCAANGCSGCRKILRRQLMAKVE